MSAKKDIYNKLYKKHETIVEIPYDFNKNGTWLETLSPTIAQISISDSESKTELDIPSIYVISDISATKDGKEFTLPQANADGKYIFTDGGSYKITLNTNLGVRVVNFEVPDMQFKNAEEAVNRAVETGSISDIEYARDLVNKLAESTNKDQLQIRLNNISDINITSTLKSASANVDVYIKSENMISLSLNTNNVTFEDFSGVEDLVIPSAVEITINSSLPYDLNAYMPSEIKNINDTNTIDFDKFNIKESTSDDYKQFESTTDKVILKEGCPSGNNKIHKIDLELKGSDAIKVDTYKTTIKFEAIQR
ncbi:MAG: hypothetical protein IJ086_15820 [Clostridium sp.]|nr:hypothetical protein [Clostridium sp.]MBQ9000142.1 hypothetical protein [Clostridium sp.]